jgi:hypothetical protein
MEDGKKQELPVTIALEHSVDYGGKVFKDFTIKGAPSAMLWMPVLREQITLGHYLQALAAMSDWPMDAIKLMRHTDYVKVLNAATDFF